MTTLIVEPNPGGHRLQAVSNVARVARETGTVVVLTSLGARARAEFAEYLADLDIDLQEVFEGPTPSPAQLLSQVMASAAEHTADHVVLMEADGVLTSWWRAARRPLRRLPRRPQISFFLTRWPSAPTWRGPWDRYFVSVRLVKSGLVLLSRASGTITRCAGFAGRDVTARGWPVRNAPDPAICLHHSRDRARLRGELDLPIDRRLAGIFGGINARKDPASSLDIVLSAGPDVDLLLAGPADDQTRAWLDGLPPQQRARVHTKDAFLSNDDLDKLVATSDVVLLLMRLEGPSGVMGKAMMADVPVLTARSTTRSRELIALHHGVAAEDSQAALVEGLRTVLEAPQRARPRRPLPTGESFGRRVLGLD